MIAWRLVQLWSKRRSAAARLHIRLVGQFAIVAIVPAILVAGFAAVIVNLGVEQWFSPKVKSALGSAVNVAQRYVQEQQSVIVGDAYEIANIIEHDPELFDAQREELLQILVERLGSATGRAEIWSGCGT